MRLQFKVSIHATLAGGDATWSPPPIAQQEVSIHATLAGGDGAGFGIKYAQSKFLSTPPSRVATPQAAFLPLR